MLVNIKNLVRVNNSINWNPKYIVFFEDRATNEFFKWITKSDALFCYWITNTNLIERDNVFLDSHYTKWWKLIIDNIKAL